MDPFGISRNGDSLNPFYYYFRSARTGVLSLSLLQRVEADNPRKKSEIFSKDEKPSLLQHEVGFPNLSGGWKEKIGGVASSSPPCRKAVNLRPNSNELLPTALLLPTTSSLRFSQRLRRERDA